MAKRSSIPISIPSFKNDRLNDLKSTFPEAFSEGKVDFEKLRAALGNLVDDAPERYTFSWAGKRDAIRLLQTPTRATLVPAPEESVDFEGTHNLFIEGDNLEVLKLLYKPYFGRVKMIYIDPPYNTGNDFIYPDDYADPLGTYLELTGQQDAEGNLLTSNPETSGRYHSAWLSMMYPRLFLARQLLREDGVIVISIDDHEAYNLRMILNEIFGEENFIAQLVWEKGRKNDAKLFSVGHEYLIVYARSLAFLKEKNTVWREPKPGAQEIWEQYSKLRKQFGNDDEAIEDALQGWYKNLPDNHPSKKLSRYKHVDKWGPWRDRDISWPGGGGPRYNVIHPKTKKPCKVPERGWGFSTSDVMQQQIKLGLIVFREDETQPPFRKAHLRPVPEELDEENIDFEDEDFDDENVSVGMQVMPSYIYKQSQVAVKYLRGLMGAKLFDNPKDHEVLARLIRYITSDQEDSLILDFFAGSGSTAEACLYLNKEFKSYLRFILVQLQEPTPEKSAAREAGYSNVADLAKERIRKVIINIGENRNGSQMQLPFETGENSLDLGFRVFKLTPSHFKPWVGVEEKVPQAYAQQMELFRDPLLEGWTVEGVLAELAIKHGFGLDYTVELRAFHSPSTGEQSVDFYQVSDQERGQTLCVCLAPRLKLKAVEALQLGPDDLFICRDAALDDEIAANLALQCRLEII